MNRDESSYPESEHWFDTLSKSFAHGFSRRTVVKLLVGGAIGVAFGGEVFAQSKFRQDSGLCEQRIPNGTPPLSLGCGSHYGVPNHFGKADFSSACKALDDCYGNCNNPKSACDKNFGSDLLSACNSQYNYSIGDTQFSNRPLYNKCIESAGLALQAVQQYGAGDYNSAQSSVCKCCSGTACFNQCCDTGETCCNGKCCPPGFCCVGAKCETCLKWYCPCDPNNKKYDTEAECFAACQSGGFECFGVQCKEISN
jgi:hypothetical protein